MIDLPPPPPVLVQHQRIPPGSCEGEALHPVRMAVPRKGKKPKLLASGAITWSCKGNVDSVSTVVCLDLKYPRGWASVTCLPFKYGQRLNPREAPRRPLVMGKKYRNGITFPCGIITLFRSRQWRVSGELTAYNEAGSGVDTFTSDAVLLKC